MRTTAKQILELGINALVIFWLWLSMRDAYLKNTRVVRGQRSRNFHRALAVVCALTFVSACQNTPTWLHSLTLDFFQQMESNQRNICDDSTKSFDGNMNDGSDYFRQNSAFPRVDYPFSGLWSSKSAERRTTICSQIMPSIIAGLPNCGSRSSDQTTKGTCEPEHESKNSNQVEPEQSHTLPSTRQN